MPSYALQSMLTHRIGAIGIHVLPGTAGRHAVCGNAEVMPQSCVAPNLSAPSCLRVLNVAVHLMDGDQLADVRGDLVPARLVPPSDLRRLDCGLKAPVR